MSQENLFEQHAPAQAGQAGQQSQNVQTGMQQSAQPEQQQNIVFNGMTITVSMRLMHFLFKEEKAQKKGNKMTKAEAFYDLLYKQQIAELTENIDLIDRGVVQLSKDWGWNRPTVNAFIDRLIEEKAACTFPYFGKSIVLLCGINGLPDNISQRLMNSETSRRSNQSRQDARDIPDKATPPSSPGVAIPGLSKV